MLVIEPTSGLCSRLYTLADAYMLAQKYNTNLKKSNERKHKKN